MTPRPRLLGAAIAVALVGVPSVAGVALVSRVDDAGAPLTATVVAPAAPAQVTGSEQVGTAPAPAPASDPYRPDPAWLERTATATGIPLRALVSYARAHLRVAAEQPRCRVAWNTIAALGGIESDHGSTGGAVLGADGRSVPAIRGPALDGGRFGAVRDTDAGALDGDTRWDRAVGPLQFIPSTWERWAADGDGDGIADPDQIDDAALAAARYLCNAGDLRDAATWRRAIFSYNHSDVYVADIASYANTYAARAAAASKG